MTNNITFKDGNIFNSKCQTLVNTVNCNGVMGKGIALVFACRYSKYNYPDMLDNYIDSCNATDPNLKLAPGKLLLFKTNNTNNLNNVNLKAPWVLHFPTKNSWKLPSEYSYIEKGLQKFVSTYKQKGIESIAFPMLGTANGGLDEKIVLDMMVKYLSQCDIPVEIWSYNPKVPDDLFIDFKNKWLNMQDQIQGIMSSKKDLSLPKSKIDLITEVLQSGQIFSMIDLINTPKIGKVTMSKCFAIAEILSNDL